MPFTLSHAVIAPPIAKTFRLPLAGVVIGCMSPDLIRILTDNVHFATLAHTWNGMVYPNLIIGVGFAVLWYVVYRPILYYYFKIEDKLPLSNFVYFLKFGILLIFAIFIGTSTHIIWDGLTHLDFRTFAFHSLLAQPMTILHWQYPLHFVLQIGFSLIALPFLAWFLYSYYQKHKVQRHLKIADYIIILLSLIFSGVMAIYQSYQYIQLNTELIRQDLYFLIGKTINVFASTGIFYFTIFCILILIKQKKILK